MFKSIAHQTAARFDSSGKLVDSVWQSIRIRRPFRYQRIGSQARKNVKHSGSVLLGISRPRPSCISRVDTHRWAASAYNGCQTRMMKLRRVAKPRKTTTSVPHRVRSLVIGSARQNSCTTTPQDSVARSLRSVPERDGPGWTSDRRRYFGKGSEPSAQ